MWIGIRSGDRGSEAQCGGLLLGTAAGWYSVNNISNCVDSKH